MNYFSQIFPAYGITAKIASFRKTENISEYHVMLLITDYAADFQTQLNHIQKAYKELLTILPDKKLRPLFKRYFLSDAANQQNEVHISESDFPTCALSIVQQPPLDGSKLAMWAYLQDDATVCYNDQCIAEHNGYTHFWLGGSGIASGNSENQTQYLFQAYESLLNKQYCTLEQNCIRTWLFVQNVDVNYAGVVNARKACFAEMGMTEKTHYIASTGIEGRHADPGVHVLLDAYAIKGLDNGQQKYLHGLTHLNPTYEYGVTFERGVAVTYGDRIHVFLSGTASINNKGQIVYPGNVREQVYRTWENVEVLLNEADCSFCDIAQMIVYLRDTADYQLVKEMFEKRFQDVPYVIVLAPVCRTGWLIEMECIAVKSCDNKSYRNF